MDFDFSPEERAFADEVEQFLDAQRRSRRLRRHAGEHGADRRHAGAPRVHEEAGRSRLARHHLAEAVRRTGRRGCLRVPAERGARRPRRTADRQGRRDHRQDAHPRRQRRAEAGVPAQDPRRRGRVRGRLQRARRRFRRRVDEAEGGPRRARRRLRLDAQRPEDVDDVGALRGVVLGRRPNRPGRAEARRHHACSSSRSTTPASRSTASGRWATSARTTSSSTTCSCPTRTSSAR